MLGVGPASRDDECESLVTVDQARLSPPHGLLYCSQYSGTL